MQNLTSGSIIYFPLGSVRFFFASMFLRFPRRLRSFTGVLLLFPLGLFVSHRTQNIAQCLFVLSHSSQLLPVGSFLSQMLFAQGLFVFVQGSFAEVAKLFTEFFRDLDVVPTDVVAGLVLLRRHQKQRRRVIVEQVRAGGCGGY